MFAPLELCPQVLTGAQFKLQAETPDLAAWPEVRQSDPFVALLFEREYHLFVTL
jgi:hypothetical protein